MKITVRKGAVEILTKIPPTIATIFELACRSNDQGAVTRFLIRLRNKINPVYFTEKVYILQNKRKCTYFEKIIQSNEIFTHKRKEFSKILNAF